MASPNRFAYGSYLLELVDTLTHEADAIPEVYDLLEAGLTQIEAGPATAMLLRGFELQLLRDLGYAPQLQTCGRCQRAFDGAAYAVYDDHQGALLCEPCAGAPRATDRYETATLTTLARLQDLPLAASHDGALTAHVAREAAALTGRLLAAHLPRPLRSLELIATLARQRA